MWSLLQMRCLSETHLNKCKVLKRRTLSTFFVETYKMHVVNVHRQNNNILINLSQHAGED